MHVNCRLLSRFLTLAQIKLIFQEGNHAFYISEQIVIVHADTFWHHIKHDVPSKRKQNKKTDFPAIRFTQKMSWLFNKQLWLLVTQLDDNTHAQLRNTH